MNKTCLLLLLPALLVAGSLTVNLSFSPADVTFQKYQGYDVVSLANQYHTSDPGEPMLPLATYQVLIPPDAEVTGIEVVSSRQQDLAGNYRILPAQKPAPLVALPLPAFVPPDPATYQSAAPYPQQAVAFVRSGCLGGYRLAGVNVVPVQYSPTLGRLTLTTRLTLRITYQEQVHPVLAVTASQSSLLGREARALVLNPEKLASWAPRTTAALDGNEVDMIVIADRSLCASFQPFADWKTKMGYKTLILGTDSIYDQYQGIDNQAQIRNCITDYWQNHGLKYVLLGGDVNTIPVRYCHLTVEGSPGDIPSDMYYASLLCSWGPDHDGYYGDMDDSVDLYHDVYVGRVPAQTATDVATFLNKDTMFEKHPDTTYLKSLLLPSEMLFPPYHGKVANDIIASTFPNGWRISKLEDAPDGAAQESLALGYELCHFCCHGAYYTFGNSLNITEVPEITCGNKTSIVNAISCLTGEFDDQECIAESLVRFPGGACVAALSNTRYGYGYPPALGPSEMIDIEYFRELLNKGCYELGGMNSLSKDYYRALSMNQEVWRWCVYELTLFGDPTLPVWTEQPSVMNVSYAGSVPASPQTMRVSVADGGQPLADAQVCLMMGASVYAAGRTNSLGWVDLFISPATTGTMNVTVTAHNCRPFENTCDVVSGANQPAITFQSLQVVDSSQRLEPGVTAHLLVMLKNSGNSQATGLNGVLRTTCSFVTITDSLDSIGTLAAGESSAGSGYQVSVAPNAPQGTVAEFYVHALASGDTWDPFFAATIGEKPNNKLWADHDTGNCILSVTSFGSIGTLGPYEEGSGFKYPRNASNGSLYCSSFMVGTDSSYVVDRFYGHPSSGIDNDWRILDSLHRVEPPERGAQEYRATYDDGNHPNAKGLTVQQWSASNIQPGYDDFVVLMFDLWNNGTNPIDSLYAGIMADFDVYNVQDNNLTSDTVRRLTYMSDPADSGVGLVGIRLLEPTTFANLSAIENAQYVAPSSMMSEAVKDSFLKGWIHVRNSPSTTNWSEVVSAGPFDIPKGWYQRVAFAFVGGESDAEIRANSDSAQSWYDQNSGLETRSSGASLKRKPLEVEPSLARDRFNVSYSLGSPGAFALRVYDLTGKLVTTLRKGGEAQGSLTWSPRGQCNGVYFIRLESAAGSETAKVILE